MRFEKIIKDFVTFVTHLRGKAIHLRFYKCAVVVVFILPGEVRF